METSLTNTCCNGCETFKALYEFMGHGANEINNNQPNILEVIDIDFLKNNLLSYTDNDKDNYHKDLNIIDESTEGDIELFDDLIDTTEKALTFLKEY
ncbi:hypothetical protein GLOIN_2v1778237 [Rhizophagus irregularis DAOM 181602=DAOM 197198]|uniref:Uncharacterized protein n=1 Tax=Rhizophagus irregularis (strain DAOM 181602 / DAOM 197198 / MUCL 43194) TaxID=747089 RepID=A0A2P4PST0_RHIID|nr:hypothetical protein GLOIN_2v1778237 [Rhizophagus irregularis DAOM 181602=DAOM 197198]POG68445.1 hypothetical protein GLOIN_2v1778237 [Rhizophagus irregularis DAOM 181602=DAOM 197198]|eukprot:XP_025175311.1 hypothetical protein GLOIN_2v1778237 [Rhizophagus irregularis DAOM 181602=DAOM 197198]